MGDAPLGRRGCPTSTCPYVESWLTPFPYRNPCIALLAAGLCCHRHTVLSHLEVGKKRRTPTLGQFRFQHLMVRRTPPPLDRLQPGTAFREQGTTLYAYGTSGPAHTIRFQNPPTSRPAFDWLLLLGSHTGPQGEVVRFRPQFSGTGSNMDAFSL